MFSLTRMDDQAFCYWGVFSPGGEALRAAGCNKTPVTKPWSSMCVREHLTDMRKGETL